MNIPALPSLRPGQCPRRAARFDGGLPRFTKSWVAWADLPREPFRFFFPLATLAGLIGVALWPLMLLGWMESYPGPSHARLMIQGFFGGFILGFMGTAMPKLVEARPLSAPEAAGLLALFLGNVMTNTLGWTAAGDVFFIATFASMFLLLRRRCHSGASQPPPSFVLMGLAVASGLAGTALQLAGRRWELSQPLELLGRLLGYHSFVLLAVLGAGGFLLPRFLGLGVRRKYPDSAEPGPEWKRAAAVARGMGLLILGTYFLEAFGWSRLAGSARALLIIACLIYEMPLERLRWSWRGVHWQIILGLACLPLGVLAAGWFSSARMTWLHVELVGGFALITFAVATRVVFGHTGAREKVERFHPWLTAGALLMLLGLVTRMSGDFLPGIQATHYLYGAGCWLLGAIIWAVCVLPRVARPDPEG